MLGLIALILSMLTLLLLVILFVVLRNSIAAAHKETQSSIKEMKAKIGKLVLDINKALRANYSVDQSQHNAIAAL